MSKGSHAKPKQPEQLWQVHTPCQCSQILSKNPNHAYTSSYCCLKKSSVSLEHARFSKRYPLDTSGEACVRLPTTHTSFLSNADNESASALALALQAFPEYFLVQLLGWASLPKPLFVEATVKYQLPMVAPDFPRQLWSAERCFACIGMMSQRACKQASLGQWK